MEDTAVSSQHSANPVVRNECLDPERRIWVTQSLYLLNFLLMGNSPHVDVASPAFCVVCFLGKFKRVRLMGKDSSCCPKSGSVPSGFLNRISAGLGSFPEGKGWMSSLRHLNLLITSFLASLLVSVRGYSEMSQ